MTHISPEAMNLEKRFEGALFALEQWYSDSVKATSFDGLSVAHTKPGAVELKLRRYPDSDQWRYLWRTARNEPDRESLVEDIEKERDDLQMSPSLKYAYVINTLEWKQAIANSELPLKQVVRLYGVSRATVYRFRKLYKKSVKET